jgi:hypothetical protein
LPKLPPVSMRMLGATGKMQKAVLREAFREYKLPTA